MPRRSPGVAPSPLGAVWIDRPLGRFTEEARAIAEGPTHDPELLHRFHQDTRRLRLALRLLRPPRPDGAGRRIDRRLRELSRLTGEIRDLDIGLSLLPRRRRGRPAGDAVRSADPLRHRFVEEAHSGRALLGAYVRAELDSGLLPVIAERSRWAESRAGRSAIRRMVARMERRQRRDLDDALRKVRRQPSSRRLHRLRRRLRTFQQLAEVAAEVRERPAPPRSLGVRSLQRQLGQLHDLDVFAAAIAAYGSGVEGSWARAAARRRESLFEEILSKLELRPLRRAMRAIGRPVPSAAVRSRGVAGASI